MRLSTALATTESDKDWGEGQGTLGDELGLVTPRSISILLTLDTASTSAKEIRNRSGSRSLFVRSKPRKLSR